jgi:hypothetical protein
MPRMSVIERVKIYEKGKKNGWGSRCRMRDVKIDPGNTTIVVLTS